MILFGMSSETDFDQLAAAEVRRRARHAREMDFREFFVDAVVSALVPEFELVRLETDDGATLSITRHTEGISWSDLDLVQRVHCHVLGVLTPRVLRASVLA